MQIVLARLDEDFEVLSDAGRDLGVKPKIRKIQVPRAVMWLNDGNETDLAKARRFAQGEGYTVFTYTGEADPLGRAKADIKRQAC